MIQIEDFEKYFEEKIPCEMEEVPELSENGRDTIKTVNTILQIIQYEPGHSVASQVGISILYGGILTYPINFC